MLGLINRVINGSVLVRGGPGTRTVKEKVELEPYSQPFQDRFLGSRTGTRTIYETGLDPGLGLARKLYLKNMILYERFSKIEVICQVHGSELRWNQTQTHLLIGA